MAILVFDVAQAINKESFDSKVFKKLWMTLDQRVYNSGRAYMSVIFINRVVPIKLISNQSKKYVKNEELSSESIFRVPFKFDEQTLSNEIFENENQSRIYGYEGECEELRLTEKSFDSQNKDEYDWGFALKDESDGTFVLPCERSSLICSKKQEQMLKSYEEFFINYNKRRAEEAESLQRIQDLSSQGMLKLTKIELDEDGNKYIEDSGKRSAAQALLDKNFKLD